MSKIIFLDIDGVLNTERWHDRCVEAGTAYADSFGYDFDPEAVEGLRRIVDETGADIVISSSWKFWGLSAMQKLWASRGLPGKVIDVTPNNVSDDMLLSIDLDTMMLPAGKGSEIKEWLTANGNPDSYAILDDMDDMLPEQQSHFVQTDPSVGITRADADSVITILTGKPPKETGTSYRNQQGSVTFAGKKIVVLGDIHGKTVWKDIIAKEQPDQVISLGDYVSTHENVSDEEQVENLKEILRYKDEHPETILLRGNHDLQHLGYYWAECSGYFPRVAMEMSHLKDEFLAKTQWIHVMGNMVFSHAGISRVWLEENFLTLDDINMLGPTELFGFTSSDPSDRFGDSPEQPPTWIRPMALMDVMIPDYIQVVGHTPVEHCFNVKDETDIPYDLWLCDALDQGEYLRIEDGIITVQNING
jgi:hypothetical protein